MFIFSDMAACCGIPVGPGYASPKDAMKASREHIFYVPCIVAAKNRPNYLTVVDVDPNSKTYRKVHIYNACVKSCDNCLTYHSRNISIL